ncbi:MAG TPA: gluconokinase [Longimicrobiaceae bacterium]|nr:gluconokinase [Longimicrobiaceae bacterium]
MTGPLVLVLDVGSSSVRAWLYDREGRGVDPGPEARSAYAWRNVPAGAMECDAGALAGRVEAVVDVAVARAREAGMEIAAVACAAFWHSLVGLDERGDPLTPVYGWGDTRAAGTAVALGERMDARAYHARTGCFLHPSYPFVKLVWLRELDAAGFARVAHWVSFPEYLESRLFGVARCSYSMGSGSGLMDVHGLAWDAAALEAAGVREAQMAPLVDAGEAARGLRPEYAARWPGLARTPWFPALGDGACANAGSGAVGAERFGATVGTSAAVRVLWEPAEGVRVPDELWCYRLDGRRWVAGGALSNGGNAVAFLRGFLDLPGEPEWEAEIARMPPDSHGLTVLPYLVGERGPGWLTETEAVVAGLRQTTPPQHLLRAWMEAIAYRVAAVTTRLEEVVGRPAEVRASGGALQASPVWTQILADVLGHDVRLSVEREATARGAALVALECLGLLPTLGAAPVGAAACFTPDPARRARYRAAMRRQATLAGALAPWLRTERSSPAEALSNEIP